MKAERKKRIALVCSGGGHLNQIKELIPLLIGEYKLSLVTLDRVDAKLSIPGGVSLLFISDIRGFRNNMKNLADSARVFFRVFPHTIVTTGAGATFTICLLGKLFFRNIVFIESFARVEGPSSFGKRIHKLANSTLYQWPGLGSYYRSGIYAGPIFNLSFESKRRTGNLIFVTVGSSEFQFNRLLKMVDQLAETLSDDIQVVAQSGTCTYSPKHMTMVPWISIEEMREYFSKCRVVITHAGTGSIVNALDCGARVIVVPRLAACKEHIDDHQIEIAREFNKLGYVTIANDLESLINNYQKIETFTFSGGFSNEKMKEIIISKV